MEARFEEIVINHKCSDVTRQQLGMALASADTGMSECLGRYSAELSRTAIGYRSTGSRLEAIVLHPHGGKQ